MHDHKEHTDHSGKESLCASGHCGHHHHHHADGGRKPLLGGFGAEALSLVLLIATVLIPSDLPWVKVAMFVVAVLPVGIPILLSTFREWRHGDVFNEFTLMVMASIGAFVLGEYAEGVAVLLFYSVGEKLEDVVSGDVKGQIRRLLGKMPRRATVIDGDSRRDMRPEDVRPGMTIAVKPGESVPLDGTLTGSGPIDFNTAAITGESLPRTFSPGADISSGVIPVDREAVIRVTREYSDSSMTRIMKMIEDASAHRAPSETILRKITRWYTPVVFGAALLLFFIPMLIGLLATGFHFEWQVWLNRSLVFLVCACPCALIVSLPLTYFASIGIASRKGILFKGHDSLDALRTVDTVLLDKTGTVTTGRFHVTDVRSSGSLDADGLLAAVAALENESTHPLAKAVVAECSRRNLSAAEATDVKAVDHGITGTVDGHTLVAGSIRLMHDMGVEVPDDITASATAIYVAEDDRFAGMISLSDTVKPDVAVAVRALHSDGVNTVGILSGDTEGTVESAAREIGADTFRARLLPEEKQKIIAEERARGHKVAFAGDGVNDAPALAAANVGIAMGNVGTDIAIESAQVVIAGDDIAKIDEGIHISRRVRYVILENVIFAFGVKIIVMILGAFGIASLWAAVFADTGVTVITVLWTLYRLKIWQLKKKD